MLQFEIQHSVNSFPQTTASITTTDIDKQGLIAAILNKLHPSGVHFVCANINHHHRGFNLYIVYPRHITTIKCNYTLGGSRTL